MIVWDSRGRYSSINGSCTLSLTWCDRRVWHSLWWRVSRWLAGWLHLRQRSGRGLYRTGWWFDAFSYRGDRRFSHFGGSSDGEVWPHHGHGGHVLLWSTTVRRPPFCRRSRALWLDKKAHKGGQTSTVIRYTLIFLASSIVRDLRIIMCYLTFLIKINLKICCV